MPGPTKTISPFAIGRKPPEAAATVVVRKAEGRDAVPAKADGAENRAAGPSVARDEGKRLVFPSAKGENSPTAMDGSAAVLPVSIKKVAHDPFWLGTRLVELKRLTAGQLETAKSMYRAHVRDGFASALERLSFAKQGEIARLIAERHGLPYVEIPRRGVAASLVRKMKQVRATHHVVCPYKEDSTGMTIAVADPDKYSRIDALRDFMGAKVNLVVAPKGDILAAIADAYTTTQEEISPKQLLEDIISWAASDDISDIHIEPKPNALIVRRRRNGRMHYHCAYGEEMKLGLVQAVKTLAKLDIGVSPVPLDGKATYKAGASTYNLRISTIPTLFGEKVVIRLQNETKNLRSLTELGLDPEQIGLLVELAAEPDGIIFITGPTGSGKTTLNYALMAVSAGPDEVVLTIEDPVEYTVTEYAQCSVNDLLGCTLEVLLRAAVRQDPDVILIGEVRDRLTAAIAIKSAQTGHRVFSTVHAVNGPASVSRLIQIGVEPFLITGAVKAVVGTRLVRTLCSCAEPMPEDRKHYVAEHYGEGTYKEARGCELCGQTGYVGQTLIAEIYPLDQPGTADLILNKATTEVFTAHMRQFGRSMYEHGMAKARAGITTIEEVLSAVRNSEARKDPAEMQH